MPIVSDWQKPLLESLSDILNSKDVSMEDLWELRRVATTLDTSDPDVSVLLVKLDNRWRSLDKEYEEAAAGIESGSVEAIQKAVEKLRTFGDYKEAEAKIKAGSDRILQIQKEQQLAAERKAAEQKKRRRIIIFAVAACVVALIAFFVVKDQIRRRDIASVLAEGQTLIDGGRERDISDPLAKLQALNADADQIHGLSGNALVRLAEREGFAAAFGLRDSLADSMPSAVDLNAFNDHAKGRLEEGLPAAEGWVVAADALKAGRLKKDDALFMKAYAAYVTQLTGQAEQGSTPSASDWESVSPYLTALKIDPALAMRLVYALSSAGADMEAWFPDGRILVDIPVGAFVSAMNRWIASSDESPAPPDMNAAIPVLIEETTTDDRQREMYTRTYSSQDDLQTGIDTLQAADSHYNVYLLPEYLVSMDETLRAKTYEECTCLVAMQQSYLLEGYTFTETEHKSTGSAAFFSPTYKTTSNYRGHFYAVDLEAFYDLKESGHFARISIEVHDPVISGDGWYDQHKDDGSSKVFTAENCLGVHDTQALSESFAETMEYLDFYELMVTLPGGTQETENTAS